MEKPTVLVEILRRQTFELRLAAPLMINQISRIIRWSDKDSNLHEKFNGDEMTAIVLWRFISPFYNIRITFESVAILICWRRGKLHSFTFEASEENLQDTQVLCGNWKSQLVFGVFSVCIIQTIYFTMTPGRWARPAGWRIYHRNDFPPFWNSSEVQISGPINRGCFINEWPVNPTESCT